MVPRNIILLAAQITDFNDGWNKERFKERLRKIKDSCTGRDEVKEYIRGVLDRNEKK